MVEPLVDKALPWLNGGGPQSDVALNTSASLVRNLADFPFSSRCSLEEKRAVEERVLAVLENSGLLGRGKYYSVEHIDAREARFLLERGFVSEKLLYAEGPRGVYVSNDQSLSIVINEEEHLRLQAIRPGLQPQKTWQDIDALDNTLVARLDFAFDERLGYLTASLMRLGTGLTIEVVLHLPAMTAFSRMFAEERRIREQHHVLEGVFGSVSEGRGDLFRLSNQTTLGRTEDEIVFHVKDAANDLIVKERELRREMKSERVRTLEDRVYRALGVARGARVLEYNEAVDLLSSLRLGVSLDLLGEVSQELINDLQVSSQRAHLELRKGKRCDDLTLNSERADLFRARLS